MSKGRRYDDTKQKLNYKKVFAVIIAVIVFVMFIIIIKNLLTKGKDTGKISSQTYFTLYQDEKWGVINNLGETVITPSYQEMIIIPNNKKDVFLCVYDINYETGEYSTKALNSKDEEIFKEYEKVEALENYDENNNVWYEEELLRVQKDGKYGLINLSGEKVLNTEYDSIETLKGISNSILVQKEGKYGLVDSSGNFIIDGEYKEIKNLGKDYTEGYITVTQEGKYGIIGYTKKQILNNEYENIKQKYGTSLYVIQENGKEKVVNSEGVVVLEDGFDTVEQILESSGPGIIFKKNNKCGVMLEDGSILIEPKYEDLKEAKQSIFIAKKDGKYGIIDEDEATKIEFQYNSITYNKQANIYIAEDENYNSYIIDNDFNIKITGILSDLDTDKGYMRIRIDDEYKYYNFKFEEKNNTEILTSNTLFLSKKDGKFGYVDKKGEVVVDYIYDDGTEQNSCGYVAVKKDGLWGSLDNKGNVVIEPIYNLDNNLIIDFIGKWHLGEDINMNYYCEENKS